MKGPYRESKSHINTDHINTVVVGISALPEELMVEVLREASFFSVMTP